MIDRKDCEKRVTCRACSGIEIRPIPLPGEKLVCHIKLCKSCEMPFYCYHHKTEAPHATKG